ncbi:MarR family winged helix-turn-helix transcriptional regulator [Fodinicola acaciae]|uniref:MarR family winged helix-turn-helix transcriptional regulator n=1 Tax=Fodinicola acaciae TaxID=2681555 RepID=UPI0013D6C43E|nr:MarR family transcriptional regulator [Fodinicola acaciae]
MHEPEALVDALVLASRALVAVAARSVAEVDADVTLTQYRALVVLASRGPQRVSALASELGVAPSTATRLIERLVRADLVDRTAPPGDRRSLVVSLRPEGQALVRQVLEQRRVAVRKLVAAMPAEQRSGATEALRAFAAAAGELPEQAWWLGFDQTYEAS